MRRKDLVGRLAKYQIAIQQYDLDIVHRSGTSNKLCDYLSRYPGVDPDPPAQTNAVASGAAGAPLMSITLDDVRDEQQKLAMFRRMIEVLEGKATAADSQEITRNYSLRFGAVYKIDPENDAAPPRLVIPYMLRERLIREAHEDSLQGAHLGIDKILAKLKRNVYWKGLDSDVQKVIRSCNFCQKRKTHPSQVMNEPIHPLETPKYPFARIHVDILGPVARSTEGFQYIFSTHCALTKWITLSAMKDQTAPTVAAAFVNDFICKHGVPSLVVSDQGRQLTSTVFADLAKLYRFKHRFTTAYHPSANGAVERDNQTVARMLSAYTNEQGTNWPDFLQHVAFSFNTSVQASTRQSPYYLLYFREPRLPLDLALDTPSPAITGNLSLYLQTQTSGIRATWEIVRKTMEQVQERQKAFADEFLRAREHQFEVQDLVLRKRDYFRRDEPAKFAPRWEGGSYGQT